VRRDAAVPAMACLFARMSFQWGLLLRHSEMSVGGGVEVSGKGIAGEKRQGCDGGRSRKAPVERRGMV
jgi:hypothetical protein